MSINRKSIERRFFRALNSVVEPAVRMGLGSPRFLPGGLIVLETKGFKTGATRRTPLVATRLGRYIFVSTFRGESSFWVKNLRKQSSVNYYLGGKAKQADAFVVMPGKDYESPESLPPVITTITDFLAPYTRTGWAFAVLATQD
jgi:deazaflavin-dependent oxidoreductase (nitroreductase family)